MKAAADLLVQLKRLSISYWGFVAESTCLRVVGLLVQWCTGNESTSVVRRRRNPKSLKFGS